MHSQLLLLRSKQALYPLKKRCIFPFLKVCNFWLYINFLVIDTASYENILKWINVNTDEVISNDIVESQYGDKKLFDLAITGDVFDHILSLPNSTALVNKMLLHCDIFARMAPNNKMRLVEELMKLDYYVGMVGDGSNDVRAQMQVQLTFCR